MSKKIFYGSTPIVATAIPAPGSTGQILVNNGGVIAGNFAGGTATWQNSSQLKFDNGVAGAVLLFCTAGLNLQGSGGVQLSISSSSIFNGSLSIAGLVFAIVTKTTAYAATNNDDVIECTGAGPAFTITLPAAPRTGKQFIVKNRTSAVVTITVASTANIDGAASQTLTTNTGATSVIRVAFDGATYIVI